MSETQVLVVAGTHGNEINAPWLFNQWHAHPSLINTYGIRTAAVIGNPEALKAGLRYLDCDLNRSFRSDLLAFDQSKAKEVNRAKELLSIYGSSGSNACQISIDLHSTTATMGTSLVIYGRRSTDLALAALVQSRLGLPVYLHEGDKEQKGFLVESWPCGFVIEIGPVSQNVLLAKTINQTRIALEVSLEEIAKVKSGQAKFPDQLVVHRHLGSIDFPRNTNGEPSACIHPNRQGKDWEPLEKGSPLFICSDGHVVRFLGDDPLVPVFINEASYLEKNIGMSLTRREAWPISRSCQEDLIDLVV